MVAAGLERPRDAASLRVRGDEPAHVRPAVLDDAERARAAAPPDHRPTDRRKDGRTGGDGNDHVDGVRAALSIVDVNPDPVLRPYLGVERDSGGGPDLAGIRVDRKEGGIWAGERIGEPVAVGIRGADRSHDYPRTGGMIQSETHAREGKRGWPVDDQRSHRVAAGRLGPLARSMPVAIGHRDLQIHPHVARRRRVAAFRRSVDGTERAGRRHPPRPLPAGIRGPIGIVQPRPEYLANAREGRRQGDPACPVRKENKLLARLTSGRPECFEMHPSLIGIVSNLGGDILCLHIWIPSLRTPRVHAIHRWDTDTHVPGGNVGRSDRTAVNLENGAEQTLDVCLAFHQWEPQRTNPCFDVRVEVREPQAIPDAGGVGLPAAIARQPGSVVSGRPFIRATGADEVSLVSSVVRPSMVRIGGGVPLVPRIPTRKQRALGRWPAQRRL